MVDGTAMDSQNSFKEQFGWFGLLLGKQGIKGVNPLHTNGREVF